MKNDPGVIFFPWDQRRIIFFPWDQLSGFVNLYAPRLGRKSLAVRSISVPLGSHVLPWQTSRVIFHQWFLLGSFSSHNLNFLSNTFVFHDLFVQTTIISLSGRREHDSPIGSTSIKSLRLWPKKRHLWAIRREGGNGLTRPPLKSYSNLDDSVRIKQCTASDAIIYDIDSFR